MFTYQAIKCLQQIPTISFLIPFPSLQRYFFSSLFFFSFPFPVLPFLSLSFPSFNNKVLDWSGQRGHQRKQAWTQIGDSREDVRGERRRTALEKRKLTKYQDIKIMGARFLLSEKRYKQENEEARMNLEVLAWNWRH